MRTQRLIDGFNNSQKIRVIVDNVGFYTTVGGTQDICTTKHRTATHMALMNLANSRYTAKVQRNKEIPVGFGFNYTDAEGTVTSVQVDLV